MSATTAHRTPNAGLPATASVWNLGRPAEKCRSSASRSRKERQILLTDRHWGRDPVGVRNGPGNLAVAVVASLVAVVCACSGSGGRTAPRPSQSSGPALHHRGFVVRFHPGTSRARMNAVFNTCRLGGGIMHVSGAHPVSFRLSTPSMLRAARNGFVFCIRRHDAKIHEDDSVCYPTPWQGSDQAATGFAPPPNVSCEEQLRSNPSPASS